MKAGDAFIPEKPYDHLYMVISDPEADPANVVLVNFTTYGPDEEECCIASAGDHPCLTHTSAIRYKDARTTSVAQLRLLVGKGMMKEQQSLTADLLQRVRAGASTSDFLPEGCRRILEDQSLI